MTTMLVPGTRMYVAMLPQRGIGGTSTSDADVPLYALDADFSTTGGDSSTITTTTHTWQTWSHLACNEANWGPTGYTLTADGLTCNGRVMSRDWSLSVLECVDVAVSDQYDMTLTLGFDDPDTGVADIYLMSEIRYLTPWVGTMCSEVGDDSGGGGHRPCEYVDCYAAHIRLMASAGTITSFDTRLGATYDGVDYPMSPTNPQPDASHAAFVGQPIADRVVVRLVRSATALQLFWGDAIVRSAALTPLHPTDVVGGSVGFAVADRLGVTSMSEVLGSSPARPVITVEAMRVIEVP